MSIAMSDAYRRFGNHIQSQEMFAQAIRLLPVDDPQYPNALLSLGTLETHEKAYSSAYFHLKTALTRVTGEQGIRDNILEINALERLGLLFRQQNLLDESESYLSDAYRLASLQKSPLLSSVFLSLARLRLAQHRPQEAVVLLKRSVELGRKTPLFLPTYFAIYYQGVALQETGDLPGALIAFQSALTLATSWRLGTSPSDSQRTGSDVILLQRIYDSYIDAGMELYKKTHDAALSARMYSLVEESRALSLREQLQSSRQMPAEYWRLLAELRRAEIALYRNESQTARESDASLRLKLNEFETVAGLGPYPSSSRANSPVPFRDSTLVQSPVIQPERFSSEKSLYPLKLRIKDGEALFSFYLGSKGSYLWVSTSQSFELHLLPPKQEIERWIRDFRSAVETSAPDQLELGERLYAELFAGTSN